MSRLDDILTVEQVAEMLSFSPWDVREMLEVGEIPGATLRGEWRISRRQLIEHVEKSAQVTSIPDALYASQHAMAN
jgi:excisionase family DNA binding protein